MRSRAIIIAVSSVLWLCLGCESKHLKEPLPLAKLPDLAYPVVLPPEETAPTPTTAAENVPTIPPAPANNRPVKPRKRSTPAKITDNKPATPPPTQPPAQETQNQKVVISPGAETSQSIAAGIPHTDDLHQRQTTAQLLQSTEDNLRALNNPNSDQQAIIAQIRNFLAQARQAQTDNDVVRAHNLALKAHLLSDELIRR
jgi:outer membrane biosynthesis protein TonB